MLIKPTPAIKELRADKVFVGMRAIDIQHGLTSDYLPEVMTDRAIIEFGSKVILVADHTKFGRVSNAFVAPVTSADVIVTDANVPDSTLRELEGLGIKIIVV